VTVEIGGYLLDQIRARDARFQLNSDDAGTSWDDRRVLLSMVDGLLKQVDDQAAGFFFVAGRDRQGTHRNHQGHVMTRAIWKYELPANPGDVTTVEIPQGGEIVHAQQQYPELTERVTIWVEVDPDGVPERRRFGFVMTGSNAPKRSHYVSTHVFGSGYWVLHLYEIEIIKDM
jgi:hypothetical protein